MPDSSPHSELFRTVELGIETEHYKPTVKDSQRANVALARLEDQLEVYEQALREIADATVPKTERSFIWRVANAALNPSSEPGGSSKSRSDGTSPSGAPGSEAPSPASSPDGAGDLAGTMADARHEATPLREDSIKGQLDYDYRMGMTPDE